MCIIIIYINAYFQRIYLLSVTYDLSFLCSFYKNKLLPPEKLEEPQHFESQLVIPVKGSLCLTLLDRQSRVLTLKCSELQTDPRLIGPNADAYSRQLNSCAS